jgi:hypothetical protein
VYNRILWWSTFGQTQIFELSNRSISINEHAEVELMLAMDKLIPIVGYSDSKHSGWHLS